MEQHFLFEEKQRFTQWWLWALLIPVVALPLILEGKAIFDDLATAVLAFGIPLGVLLLLGATNLKTTVSKEEINVRFVPFFINKTVPWDELQQAYVRKYHPLREYGGWGLRFGISGRAYNIRGNQGLQLVFKNGKKLLIGTQKPDELATVINQISVDTRIGQPTKI